MDCLGRTLARALSMVALTVLVAGTYATLVASPAAAQVVIVSAGDSYASGEGAADGSPSAFPVWRGDDTDGLAQPCHRSTLAGAAVAAAQLGSYKPVAFASVACTGSVTGATPPGGLSPNTDYFVINASSGTSFQVATSANGKALPYTGSGPFDASCIRVIGDQKAEKATSCTTAPTQAPALYVQKLTNSTVRVCLWDTANGNINV